MAGPRTQANIVQKNIEPAQQPKQEVARQHEHGAAQLVAQQAVYRRAQMNRNGLMPAHLLALQRTVGNRDLQRMLARRNDRANNQQQSILTEENGETEVQAALAIDARDDGNEKEANQVGGMATRMAEAPGAEENGATTHRLLAHELTHEVQQKGSQTISATVQRVEEKGTSSIKGQIGKDKPGPVTDKSNSQFTLTVNEAPPGKHYYFRWSARDAGDNSYLMRSVDDDAVVQSFGNSKHAYLNTPSLYAMLEKGAGLGCQVLCRVIETDSPEAPRPFHRITENSSVFSLNFAFLPPANLEKIETVFEHLRQGKWDVDTLAAKLTDSEMLSIDLGKRVNLITHIVEGNLVGGEDETTIIRLIAATPSQDIKGLFNSLNADNARMYKKLEKALDGDNYRKYHQTLSSKFPETIEPEEALKETETALILPWASPGVIHSYWNRRFVYEDVSINDAGRIHVEFWSTFMGMGLKFTTKRDLDPNELIGVHFYFQEEEVGAPKGKTIYMPAVNFLSLYNKQFRQNWKLVGDVALLSLGGAGLIGATTKLGKVVAALELAFGVADIAINEFRSEIAETETGREFLKVWDTISFVVGAYGMARVAWKLPSVFKGLKNAFEEFKGSKSNLKPGDLEKVKNSVNDLLDKAEEAAKTGQEAAQAETKAAQASKGRGEPVGSEKVKPPETEPPKTELPKTKAPKGEAKPPTKEVKLGNELPQDQVRRYNRYAKQQKAKGKDPLSPKEWYDKIGKKPPRNRYGKRGDPASVAEIARLRQKAQNEFPNDIIHEGTSIKGKTGINRQPDVWVEDAQTGAVKKVYEAAKTKPNGEFVEREMAKKAEYDAAGIPNEFGNSGPVRKE